MIVCYHIAITHLIVGFYFLCLLKVPGFDEILIETINLCCHYYENHMYVMPKEKYILLKVSHFIDHYCSGTRVAAVWIIHTHNNIYFVPVL